jgi:hypothetical protein
MIVRYLKEQNIAELFLLGQKAFSVRVVRKAGFKR